mmetsp:Transcript_65802/g.185208  ORF Transcript_65802/g.185208 Transcript_65802/m.185208 type:complete len:135 (+) Transcript_65802:34-438(+)
MAGFGAAHPATAPSERVRGRGGSPLNTGSTSKNVRFTETRNPSTMACSASASCGSIVCHSSMLSGRHASAKVSREELTCDCVLRLLNACECTLVQLFRIVSPHSQGKSALCTAPRASCSSTAGGGLYAPRAPGS